MSKGTRWDESEVSILLENYKTKTVDELAELLPGRSCDAIKQRAQQEEIALDYIPWTEEEFNIIRQYYPTEGKKVQRRLPNRSVKNIQVTAFRLGVKRQRNAVHRRRKVKSDE